MTDRVQLHTVAKPQRIGTPTAITKGAAWVLGSMVFYKFCINLIPYYAEEAVNYETTLIY
jgi:hypothetical protein